MRRGLCSVWQHSRRWIPSGGVQVGAHRRADEQYTHQLPLPITAMNRGVAQAARQLSQPESGTQRNWRQPYYAPQTVKKEICLNAVFAAGDDKRKHKHRVQRPSSLYVISGRKSKG
jgi:hypothetical protein